MAYLLLYIALTWLVLMPARFRAMAKGYRKASLALKALPTALAAACGGKAARMMEAAEAERRSGYKVGGVSPFGQQRPVPVWFERDALAAASVWINAGQRGLLLEIAPADALRVLQASSAAISR